MAARHSRAASAALFFDGLSVGDAVWVSDEKEAWFEAEVESVGVAEGAVGGASTIMVRGSSGSAFPNKEFQVKRTSVTGGLDATSSRAGGGSKKKRAAPRTVLPRSTRLLGKEGVSNMVSRRSSSIFHSLSLPLPRMPSDGSERMAALHALLRADMGASLTLLFGATPRLSRRTSSFTYTKPRFSTMFRGGFRTT